MDSKQIHIKAQYLLTKRDLDNLPSGGWLYCGRSDDLKTALLKQAIAEVFVGDNIYFVSTRHDSRIEAKSKIINIIAANIDENNFTLWSENFCKVMEFKNIGVFRFGSVCG